MTPRLASIGVDPGPIPGVVVVGPDGAVHVVQCSAGLLLLVVRTLALELAEPGTPTATSIVESPAAVLAVERFVVGRRAARSSTPAAGQQTRDQVGALQALAAELGVPVRLRTASEVMPWATDARLDAAGLLDATKGMRHARAAARHALYTAHRDCGAPDPLSRKARS